MTPAAARAALWEAGDISYLLLEHQLPIRAAICSSPSRRYVLLKSRRWGGSALLCCLAIEQCLQQPGSSVRYAAATSDMVEEIIEPLMEMLLEDCPSHLAPAFSATKFRWTFPNGSSIRVAGCDERKKANRLRGRACHLALIDEAGFIDELTYVVGSVLMPQFMTTNGRMVLSSSAPETPAHPFRDECVAAESAGAFTMQTIFDATHVDDATRDEYRIDANLRDRFDWKPGDPDGTTWRREYLCEFVVDETKAVLPEFQAAEKAITEARPLPPHFIPIIVGDIGYHDQSFLTFGYHDFKAGLDYVQAEYAVNRTLAREIDKEATKIATELWGETKAASCNRYADAPAQVIAELSGEKDRVGRPWSGIAKTQTDGTFLTAATNDLRQRIGDRTTRISPTCKRLIAQCRSATWAKPGRDYERIPGYGHFDGVAALTYFTRLVDRRTNPYPRDAGLSYATHTFWPQPDPRAEQLKNLNMGASRWRR